MRHNEHKILVRRRIAVQTAVVTRRFVDVAIGVRELDIEMVNGRADRHARKP